MITYFNKNPTKIETKMIFETLTKNVKHFLFQKPDKKSLKHWQKMFYIFCQCFKLFLSGRYFCVFVLVFVNALFKVCLKFVSPDVKTVFLYGRNHAFDNLFVKVGPQSKMGLWDNIVYKDFFIKLWRNKLKVCKRFCNLLKILYFFS